MSDGNVDVTNFDTTTYERYYDIFFDTTIKYAVGLNVA